MRLVDLKYYFECDSPIELSDNNLPASELVENRSFFKPITIEENAVLMIIKVFEV